MVFDLAHKTSTLPRKMTCAFKKRRMDILGLGPALPASSKCGFLAAQSCACARYLVSDKLAFIWMVNASSFCSRLVIQQPPLCFIWFVIVIPHIDLHNCIPRFSNSALFQI